MIHPDNQRHARIWAVIYVRQLLARKYGSEQAAMETSLGCAGPNDAGYSISHGKISVPACKPNWTFRFDALEREIRNPVVAPEPKQEVFAF